MFEVVDQETKEVRVVKDCWVENRGGKQVEHEIVAGIKGAISTDDFLEHFVDICAHRKTDTSGGFQEVCNILTMGVFEPLNNFRPQPLVLARTNPKPIYSKLAGNSTPNQSHQSRQSPPPTQPAPTIPPHPRFRYQVVYSEKGISLFEVSSLRELFVCLEQVVNGTRRGSANQNAHLRLNLALLHLHKAGWVYRDLSPGNVIMINKQVKMSDQEFARQAKISDLEFAKKRVARDLERLTRRTDRSLSVEKGTRAVSLRFDVPCEPH